MKDESAQKGQTLVFILLISVVGLTLGLAMAGRSISHVTQTQEKEDYNRAFSAAEAGLEEAALQIKNDPDKLTQPIPVTEGTLPGSNATYSYECNPVDGTDSVELDRIAKDDVGQVNLVDENGTSTSGDLIICWQKSSDLIGGEEKASVVISVVAKPSDYTLDKYAYNPVGAARGNGFAPADAAVNCPSGYENQKTISLPSVAQLLRVRPMYGGTSVYVKSTSSTLGFQYQKCVATGTSGDNTAKEQFTISYPVLPAIFDYVLFSGSTSNSLTHQ